MQWYWWALIAWVLAGLVAFALDFLGKPAMRENIGLDNVLPVLLGPLWLLFKLGQAFYSYRSGR